MFGSVFRSILVIGTIYALSPVKFDGSAVPSAQASTSKVANAGQKHVSATDQATNQPLQSAAIALVTGINPLASGQGSNNKTPQQKDQIGDLIALGKDVCLANPGLCADLARTAATTVVRQNGSSQQANQSASQTSVPSSTHGQTQTTAQRQTAQNSDPSKTPNKSKSQPDLLGALIEQVATPTTKALAEKMVVKAQR